MARPVEWIGCDHLHVNPSSSVRSLARDADIDGGVVKDSLQDRQGFSLAGVVGGVVSFVSDDAKVQERMWRSMPISINEQ